MMIAGGIAAVPLVLIVLIYVSMHGRVFFDIEPSAGGDHVVVQSGRAGLRGFAWLPASGYGTYVADTGLTRAMVAPEQWKKIEDRDLGSSRGEWDDLVAGIMAPRLAGLVDYATTGSARPSMRCASRSRTTPRISRSCSPNCGRSRGARRRKPRWSTPRSSRRIHRCSAPRSPRPARRHSATTSIRIRSSRR